MSPLIAGKMIDGVEVRQLISHPDSRGDFTEFFSQAWDGAKPPAQWSVVTSVAGVLRGMHLHRRHDEGFLLLRGKANVGLHDIRPGSPTQGVSSLFEFTAEPLLYLTFPRGIVHGWMFPEPSIHLQSVSETYGEYGGDDNLGCHWSDPALDLPWPGRPTLVAPRAEAFGSLSRLIADTLRIDPGFRY